MRLAIPLTLAAVCFAAMLALPGCGQADVARADPAFAARSETAGRFLIGTPDQYQRPGVYTRFARSHGIYLVSDHDMLVALADTCPNRAHRRQIGVRWNPEAYIFVCPACGWKFTSDGLPIATSAERADAPGAVQPLALERCNIRNDGPLYDPGTELQVNANAGRMDDDGWPNNRLVFEKNQWSRPGGMYVFDELRRRLDKRSEDQPLDDQRIPAIFR
ncbi:MAG: hypothetical protein AAF916_05540 [Planctomycetota bacterium]